MLYLLGQSRHFHLSWSFLLRIRSGYPSSLFPKTVQTILAGIPKVCSISLFFHLYLSKRSFSTQLESVSPNHCLTIQSTIRSDRRSNSAIQIFIDNVQITQPDLFNNGKVIVGFLASFSPFSVIEVSNLIQTFCVLKIFFETTEDKELTLFSPNDALFNAKAVPDLSMLSSLEFVILLQYHATTRYIRKALLKNLSKHISMMEAAFSNKLKNKQDSSIPYKVSCCILTQSECFSRIFNKATKLFDEIPWKRFELHFTICSTIIAGHYSKGMIDEAGLKLDAITYNNLMSCYCQSEEFPEKIFGYLFGALTVKIDGLEYSIIVLKLFAWVFTKNEDVLVFSSMMKLLTRHGNTTIIFYCRTPLVMLPTPSSKLSTNTSSSIDNNYHQVIDNLPTFSAIVLSLIFPTSYNCDNFSFNTSPLKLYDSNHQMVKSLSNSIKLVVGIPDVSISFIANLKTTHSRFSTSVTLIFPKTLNFSDIIQKIPKQSPSDIELSDSHIEIVVSIPNNLVPFKTALSINVEPFFLKTTIVVITVGNKILSDNINASILVIPHLDYVVAIRSSLHSFPFAKDLIMAHFLIDKLDLTPHKSISTSLSTVTFSSLIAQLNDNRHQVINHRQNANVGILSSPHIALIITSKISFDNTSFNFTHDKYDLFFTIASISDLEDKVDFEGLVMIWVTGHVLQLLLQNAPDSSITCLPAK